ncbi:MAG: hypothetical protein ISEC1_P2067 [Thiomicrorhabdus sp.]|nr:MAG: hypothetical protein ISEC1_P2067 [Thiomicrorhabdus sp.]
MKNLKALFRSGYSKTGAAVGLLALSTSSHAVLAEPWATIAAAVTFTDVLAALAAIAAIMLGVKVFIIGVKKVFSMVR